MHVVTADPVFAVVGGRDYPKLRPPVEAAAQVISGKTGLYALLNAHATGCERHLVGVMAGKRGNVAVSSGYAVGVRNWVHSASIG